MEKEFVPYEQALALEELGFSKPCFGYHLCKNSALGVYLEITTEWIDLFPYDSSSCKAPTFSQSFRWFREKYTLHPLIEQTQCDFRCSIVERPRVFHHIGGTFDTYEEAELECLKKLIEIVKQKK